MLAFESTRSLSLVEPTHLNLGLWTLNFGRWDRRIARLKINLQRQSYFNVNANVNIVVPGRLLHDLDQLQLRTSVGVLPTPMPLGLGFGNRRFSNT